MRKYLAELFGTYVLAMAVVVSLNSTFPVATPVIAAITLGLFVYTVGHISGTHLNPAVTLGIWSIGKIPARSALGYLAAQFAGGALALQVSARLGAAATVPAENTLAVGLAELIGTLFFTFGIAAVVYGKVPPLVSGLVIGGSLLLGLSIATLGSNAILNPAVALGIHSWSWMYLAGPIFGSVIGMQLFKWISSEKTLASSDV